MYQKLLLKKAFNVLILLLIILLLSPIAIRSEASSKGISLNKKEIKIKVGGTATLKASSSNSKVKWTTDNKSVATVKNGQVTAKKVGTATIKVESGNMSATCKVIVYQPAKKVTLTPSSSYIEIGDTFKVTAKITPANTTYKSLTWKVENESYYYGAVQQVSKNTFKAVDSGTATIIAYQKDTNKEYKLSVEVKEPLGTFHIEENNKKVTSLNTFIGGHILINGVMDDDDYYWWNDTPKFTYSIGDKRIASVDNRGQITGLATGSTTVSITALNGKSVSCKLNVAKAKEELAIDTFYADNVWEEVAASNYGNWSNWSNADYTYMLKMYNKQIGVVNRIADKEGQKLQLYLYDENFNFLNKKVKELPYTEWGGFYQGEDGYYYAAVGQLNKEEDDSKTVFAILKLDKQLNEIGRCNITGSQSSTTVSYKVGAARMAMDGTTLIVHTDRERYTSSDGLNHQSNITFMIDSFTMQQIYVGELFPYNHVSHSFNQFVKIDGGNLIYVDHGDAYPRSVVLQTHYGFSPYGWSDNYSSRPNVSELDLMNIVGRVGDNYTGTKVNGFELGMGNNIVAGVSIPHHSLNSDSLKSVKEKNVYASLVSKDGRNSQLIWLTDYQEGKGISAENLRMVKISDNEFALLYKIVKKDTANRTGLIIIDSYGTVLKKKEYDTPYSCYVQPIYYEDSIVWIDSLSNWDDEYYWYDSDDMNKENIEKSQFTRIYLK